MSLLKKIAYGPPDFIRGAICLSPRSTDAFRVVFWGSVLVALYWYRKKYSELPFQPEVTKAIETAQGFFRAQGDDIKRHRYPSGKGYLGGNPFLQQAASAANEDASTNQMINRSLGANRETNASREQLGLDGTPITDVYGTSYNPSAPPKPDVPDMRVGAPVFWNPTDDDKQLLTVTYGPAFAPTASA
jgi:hypothetical protein